MCVPYFLTAVYLLALDGIFIRLNQNFMESNISRIQHAPVKVNYLGLLLCYFALITGVYYFIVRTNRGPWEAFLLGVFVYGVYETTNYTTFQKWREELVIMDTLWGGVLFALTAFLVKFTIQKLKL